MAAGDPDARLFVYGTLRSDAPAPASVGRVVRAGTDPIGRGWIRARLYDAGGFPAAVPDERARVVGEVRRLRRPDRTLALLDRYERAGGPDPLFRREAATVHLEGDGSVRAWVYFWERDTSGLAEIESGDWTSAVGGEGG